jgi:hypothetical protein
MPESFLFTIKHIRESQTPVVVDVVAKAIFFSKKNFERHNNKWFIW